MTRGNPLLWLALALLALTACGDDDRDDSVDSGMAADGDDNDVANAGDAGMTGSDAGGDAGGGAATGGSYWKTSSPEAQGLGSPELADVVETIDEMKLDVHSLLIVRNGYLVIDAYFPPYDGRAPHDLASATKSVMTTLVGIALDQHFLSGLDRPMLSFFEKATIADDDKRREAITVEHLVSMTSGMDCNREFDEPRLREMLATDDWVSFALNIPMRATPGSEFAYCSPGMHLLSAIVTQETGMSTRAFAEEVLFGPLGIEEYYWPHDDPQGLTNGWGDLRLRPGDMAKIGYLFLQQGRWEGKQLVSADWVEAATRRHSDAVDLDPNDDHGYGYGWWIMGGEYEAIYYASGRGGQTILVWPAQDSVLVLTGADYDRDLVLQMLVAAVKSTEPLPEDPDGAQRLAAALEAIQRTPEPHETAAPPDIAGRVSGERFALPENPFGVTAFELQFAEDGSRLVLIGTEDQVSTLEIGFDGVARVSKDAAGIGIALTGEWTGPMSVRLHYVDTAGYKKYDIEFTFAADAQSATVDVADVTGQWGNSQLEATRQ